MDELYKAAQQGNLLLVKQLLNQSKNYDIQNAFTIAISNNCLEVVKYLVEQGADIHSEKYLCGTPLEYAVNTSNIDIDIVKYLIGCGAYVTDEIIVDTHDEEIKRLLRQHQDLIDQADKGDTSYVEYLLDRGVNIHVNNDGALIGAAWSGHTETVELLLNRGANIHARNNDPLRNAACYGGYYLMVKLLLDRGATVTDEIINSARNENISELLRQAQQRRSIKPAKVVR